MNGILLFFPPCPHVVEWFQVKMSKYKNAFADLGEEKMQITTNNKK